jgi:hypothetical protein
MPFATISAPSFMHLYWYPPSRVKSAMSSWFQNAETGLHMKMLTNVKMTSSQYQLCSSILHEGCPNHTSRKSNRRNCNPQRPPICRRHRACGQPPIEQQNRHLDQPRRNREERIDCHDVVPLEGKVFELEIPEVAVEVELFRDYMLISSNPLLEYSKTYQAEI